MAVTLPEPTQQPRYRQPKPQAQPVEVPETLGYRWKNRLLGPPLNTDQLAHERLGKPTALAVFASDNLSSSAYATEEILKVLIPAVGVAAFALVVPVTVALLVVLGFLILSYRQTIKAYPTAGGAYIVTRDNFGLLPAQVAGVSLLIDYILTVSVSVAAGTAAIASAFSAIDPYVVPISVAFIVLIAYGNLRGVKESGRLFAVPTYFFILDMVILLGYGTYRLLFTHLPVEHVHKVGMVAVRQRGRRPPDGRRALQGADRVRERRRRRDRCRGDLERRPGVQGPGMEERPRDAGDHGHHARRNVPRPVGAGRQDARGAVREGHADRHLADREARLRHLAGRNRLVLHAAGRHRA